jgi:hypothetical protein
MLWAVWKRKRMPRNLNLSYKFPISGKLGDNAEFGKVLDGLKNSYYSKIVLQTDNLVCKKRLVNYRLFLSGNDSD